MNTSVRKTTLRAKGKAIAEPVVIHAGAVIAPPERLLSYRALIRRSGVDRRRVEAAIRAGRLTPDFRTDAGAILFRPEVLGRLDQLLAT